MYIVLKLMPIAIAIRLHEVIPADALELFSSRELEFLICGVREIDVVGHGASLLSLLQTTRAQDDWRRHTQYQGYNDSAVQVLWFWETLQGMSPTQRVCICPITPAC